MRNKNRPQKQKAPKGRPKGTGRGRGRPPSKPESIAKAEAKAEAAAAAAAAFAEQRAAKRARIEKTDDEDMEDAEDIDDFDDEDPIAASPDKLAGSPNRPNYDEQVSEGLHMTTSQVSALAALVCCRECGENVTLGVRPTTKGMISEFTVACTTCSDKKSTNTPNLIRERKRKYEKKNEVLQKTENINYAHVAAFLDNGLGYSGLKHYCKYFNSRCLNEATFIVYARQVIADVVADTEDSLHFYVSIVRELFKSQLETDGLIDLTVAYTTTYHQWGSDFCLVAGAVIELTTGLVLDYDVANMYCHVCKINAKKIVNMSPADMTEWFNKHQDTCEIREWCDELDHDADEGVREIEPKYLECFIAKKIWSRSVEKYGFRYTTMIHESDERIHDELANAQVYGDVPILIDQSTSCFSRRKSEHARTSFQTKLKAKCPRERVQTKDRIMYVYAMSVPEYNKFAISSNFKLRALVREMEAAAEAEVGEDGMEDGEEGEGEDDFIEMGGKRREDEDTGEEAYEEEVLGLGEDSKEQLKLELKANGQELPKQEAMQPEAQQEAPEEGIDEPQMEGIETHEEEDGEEDAQTIHQVIEMPSGAAAQEEQVELQQQEEEQMELQQQQVELQQQQQVEQVELQQQEEGAMEEEEQQQEELQQEEHLQQEEQVQAGAVEAAQTVVEQEKTEEAPAQ